MRSVKHVAVVVLTSCMSLFLGLLTSVLLARTLGPTGRGVMATVLLWPQVLIWIAGLSYGSGNIYMGARHPGQRHKLFSNSLLVALMTGLPVGAVTAKYLPDALGLHGSEKRLLVIGLLSLPAMLWGEYVTAILQGAGEFIKFSIVKLISPLTIACGLVGCLLTHSLTIDSAIYVTWAGYFLPTVVACLLLGQSGTLALRPDLSLLKSTLKYSLRVYGGAAIGITNRRADQIIMTAIVTPYSLGLYAFAVSIAEMMTLVTSAISAVLLPRAARERDPSVRIVVVTRAIRWTVALSICGALALAVAIPIILPWIWGDKFSNSIVAIWILLPGTIAIGANSAMVAALQAGGRPASAVLGESACLIMTLPALYILLPRLGIYGAATASTCGYVISAAITAVQFRRLYGFTELLSFRAIGDDCREVFGSLRARNIRRGSTGASASLRGEVHA